MESWVVGGLEKKRKDKTEKAGCENVSCDRLDDFFVSNGG